MYEEHPCNICGFRDKCHDMECPLDQICNKINCCQQYDCFLNYEGSCKISIYDDCGSRKTADGETPGDDEEDPD